MKKKMLSVLWAGDDQSFDLFSSAVAKYSELSADPAKFAAAYGQLEPKEAEEPKSRLLQIEQGVAVISISGVLVNSSDWWVEYVGTGYPEINAALMEAVADPSVYQILLDIDSPGGTVSGVSDTANTIAEVSKIKEVTAFSDSMMASGAMWLGAAAKRRFVGATNISGSIGVIFKHFEYSEMLKNEGIKATVFRGGEFKALASSEEKLSAKAVEVLEGQVQYLYGVFVQAIADFYDLSYQAVDSRMAQGREFIGQEAVDVGLADGVSTFNAVFASLVEKATKQQGDEQMNKRYTTFATAMAAAASGTAVPLPELPEGEAAEAPEATADSHEEVPEIPETPEASADSPEEVEEVPPPAVEVLQAKITDLTAQVAASQEAVIDAKADLKSAQKDFQKLEASVQPMKEIVAAAINVMQIALGGADTKVDANVSVETLVSRHAEVAKSYCEKFVPGGVSSVEADAETETDKAPAASALEQAQRRALKLVHKN